MVSIRTRSRRCWSSSVHSLYTRSTLVRDTVWTGKRYYHLPDNFTELFIEWHNRYSEHFVLVTNTSGLSGNVMLAIRYTLYINIRWQNWHSQTWNGSFPSLTRIWRTEVQHIDSGAVICVLLHRALPLMTLLYTRRLRVRNWKITLTI